MIASLSSLSVDGIRGIRQRPRCHKVREAPNELLSWAQTVKQSTVARQSYATIPAPCCEASVALHLTKSRRGDSHAIFPYITSLVPRETVWGKALGEIWLLLGWWPLVAGSSLFEKHTPLSIGSRPSSREVRIRVLFFVFFFSFFSVVYFSRGTLPPKKRKRAPLGGPGDGPENSGRTAPALSSHAAQGRVHLAESESLEREAHGGQGSVLTFFT